MLRADENGLDLNRPAVAIPHADLSLRVRTKPGDASHVAVPGELRGEPVREEDRQRHPLGRLIRGISEHEPLIASPLRGAGGSLDGVSDLPRVISSRMDTPSALKGSPGSVYPMRRITSRAIDAASTVAAE